MDHVRIILVDWVGYPVKRQRRMGRKKFPCGLDRVLQNFEHHSAGVKFDVYLIINGVNEYIPSLRDRIRVFPTMEKDQWIKAKTERYKRYPFKYQFVRKVLFRSNEGRDIGGYNYGYTLLKEEGYDSDVIFMNSNVRGPFDSGWLLKYYELFRKWSDTGACGISLNSHFKTKSVYDFQPHIQSFFIYTSMPVLKNVFPGDFPGASVQVKEELIRVGEVGISQEIIEAGYGICANAFEDFQYKKGRDWKIPTGDLREHPDYSETANLL